MVATFHWLPAATARFSASSRAMHVMLAAALLLPVVVGSGRSLLLDSGEAAEDLPPGCDEGVLEYLVGSKVNVSIIPYRAPCINHFNRIGGHHLRMPGTTALHLKGIPKTGTTWTEMVVTELLERICDSHIYIRCQHEHRYDPGHNRQLHLMIPGQEEEDNRAAVIRFTVQYKHALTYRWTCDHLHGHANFTEECRAVKIDRVSNPVRNPMRKEMHAGRGEEWKDCIYKGPYSRIQECIPEYMHVMKFPWNADMGTLELLHEAMHSGHAVDLETAQRKYLLTLRDPRDSAISNSRYVEGRREYANPNEYVMREGCKEYISAFALFYYWQVEVQGSVYPTLPIWYRDAVDDPIGEVERILEFTGLRAPMHIIDEVVNATSATAMRILEENDNLVGANRNTDARKTREAHYNTYLEQLNSTALAMCNDDMRRVLSEPMLRKFGMMD